MSFINLQLRPRVSLGIFHTVRPSANSPKGVYPTGASNIKFSGQLPQLLQGSIKREYSLGFGMNKTQLQQIRAARAAAIEREHLEAEEAIEKEKEILLRREIYNSLEVSVKNTINGLGQEHQFMLNKTLDLQLSVKNAIEKSNKKFNAAKKDLEDHLESLQKIDGGHSSLASTFTSSDSFKPTRIFRPPTSASSKSNDSSTLSNASTSTLIACHTESSTTTLRPNPWDISRPQSPPFDFGFSMMEDPRASQYTVIEDFSDYEDGISEVETDGGQQPRGKFTFIHKYEPGKAESPVSPVAYSLVSTPPQNSPPLRRKSRFYNPRNPLPEI